MTANQSKTNGFFRVGGTMGPDAPSYVAREADQKLPRLARDGMLCYVLTARQMGKSSLMVRTAQCLQAEGFRTATIDLTEIGTHGVGMEVWYLSFISQVHSQLGLAADYRAWWRARSGLSPVQRFSDFLRQVVLDEISDHVVIFVDEIDCMLNLEFSDDFFAAIRALYNMRASDSTYRRLTLVLLGAAMPSELISDEALTPFNIGQGVGLKEFSLEEGAVLQAGLERVYPGEGESLFGWIYSWTSGHPYLTQKLCAEAASRGEGLWTEARVDALVEETFLTEEAARAEVNLQFIRDRLQASQDRDSLLRIYRQVRMGAEVPDEERSALKNRLKLWGLVKATPERTLVVRNRIYEWVFDLDWVRQLLPRGPAAQLAEAIRAILESLRGREHRAKEPAEPKI